MVQRKKTRKTKRKKYSLTALKFSIFMERNDVSLAGRLKPIQYKGHYTYPIVAQFSTGILAHFSISIYTQEKANGKIIYKVVDISKKENEAIADKYEVTWSSLFVNGWKDGKENVNNMTEFSFSNARNAPDKFKEGIKSKIDELLKQL